MQNRMRVEGFAGIAGQVAHHLHPPKPMGKSGVLERVYTALAVEGLKMSPAFSLDSTAVKAHPDAHGARKKTAAKR